MASEAGRPSSALMRRLETRGQEHSLFQLLRLLKRAGFSTDALSEGGNVRVRPELALDHAASEVTDVSFNEATNSYDITTTIGGLYGVSSPLPAYYTENLQDGIAQDETLAKDLLDVFHQRLYDLAFQADKKYDLLLNLVESTDKQTRDLLYQFIGLDHDNAQKRLPHARKLLRYIGLFQQQPRNALGLQTILQDVFEDIPVLVTQCVERSVKIRDEQRLSLGKGESRLGENTVLGEEIFDAMGKIAVEIGPMSKQQFQTRVNDPDQWGMLLFLIRFYLISPVSCEIRLRLAPGEANTLVLGDSQWATLGQNTWLFSGQTQREYVSVLHPDLSAR